MWDIIANKELREFGPGFWGFGFWVLRLRATELLEDWSD